MVQPKIGAQLKDFGNQIWFCFGLWHVNHCRLFNAKSFLYIYIKYIGFGWIRFYGLSTVVGYLIWF